MNSALISRARVKGDLLDVKDLSKLDVKEISLTPGLDVKPNQMSWPFMLKVDED